MRVLIEEIEGNHYLDILLSEKDVNMIRYGEMITRDAYMDGKRLHIGIYEIKDLVYGKEREEFEEDIDGNETC